ncbi:hypothetical protein LCI18_003913 [Fusarium solani-melongenae]|uniref:Uncharacterized protein n=1 Tax=Fusarium solani subsp. cucurbitae TaxID=2747967 RepID=A0ACD3YVF5_FUSSC|nr:hypothetical protein LCI18_003913 [Fusarium solani-melongenae]
MSPQETTVLQIGDLLPRMIGLDTLDSWSVLVAYSEKTLNELLKERHEALPPSSTCIYNLEVADPLDPRQTIKYRNILLHAPLIELQSSEGRICLLFALDEGWYTESGEAEKGFDSGLFLEVQADLVNVSGRAGSATSSAATTPVGVVRTFEKPGESSCHVAIDLSNPFVSIVNGDRKPEHSLANVASALTDHIAKLGLQYQLATVQRDPEADARSPSGKPTVVLKPTDFVMTVLPGTTSSDGALLLWMAVEGTSRGKVPSKSSPLTFNFSVNDPRVVSPISSGHTASVIISREVVETLFIKPQLTALGFTDIVFDPKPEVPKAGFGFQATPPKDSITVDSFQSRRPGQELDFVTFDLCSAPFKFWIEKLGSNVQMEYKASKIENFEERFNPFDVFDTRKGDIFHVEGRGEWTYEDDKLSLIFDVPASHKARPGMDDKGAVQEFLRQKASEGRLPLLMRKIDLGAINLFLTTNLLLPGKHVFNPNMPDGIYFPWDLMMQGCMQKA